MNTDILIVSNAAFLLLWLCSEMMGMSTCEYNGVFQFIFSCGGCMKGKKIIVDVHIQEDEAIVTVNGSPPIKIPVPHSPSNASLI